MERQGKEVKKYKLTSNIRFLVLVMRQASKASFLFVILRIPLEVIIPYIGIWFPNLMVRAIEVSANWQRNRECGVGVCAHEADGYAK